MIKEELISKINNIQEILTEAKNTLEKTNVSIYEIIAYIAEKTDIDLRY